MLLPVFQSKLQDLMLMQNRWTSILNPVLSLPLNSTPSYLTGISVVSGVNVINHLLGRIPQGWIITDINAPVTLYRSSAFSATTLSLTSSGSATVALIVF